MLYIPIAALLASMVSAASVPAVQPGEHLKIDFSVWRGKSRSEAVQVNKGASAGNTDPTLVLADQRSYYAAIVKVGSNGRENSVLLDTGSADLWVIWDQVDCSALSSSSNSKRSFDENPQSQLKKKASSGSGSGGGNSNPCTQLGSFDPDSSLTFQLNNTAGPFSILYGDGSGAYGLWGTDTVGIGSVEIPNCSIAVASSTGSLFGTFGIGLTAGESTYVLENDSDPYKYENFPVLLKKNGLINKVAYSLYLDDETSLSGSVLFGAVDHAKYSGQLQTVPLVNIYPGQTNQAPMFNVVVNSMALEGPSKGIVFDNSPIAVLLDSGTTSTHLPQSILASLASTLGGKYNQQYEIFEVSCSYNTSSISMAFSFSGAQITVPLSNYIISDNTNCYLGIFALPDSSSNEFPEAIFGDDFLRSAYVVYNLEDLEVSLAEAVFTSESNIEPISSSIPLAVKAPGYSSTYIVTSVPPQTPTIVTILGAPDTTSGSPVNAYTTSASGQTTSVSSKGSLANTIGSPNNSQGSSGLNLGTQTNSQGSPANTFGPSANTFITQADTQGSPTATLVTATNTVIQTTNLFGTPTNTASGAKSEGSSSFRFAKSILAAMVGLSFVFVF